MSAFETLILCFRDLSTADGETIALHEEFTLAQAREEL